MPPASSAYNLTKLISAVIMYLRITTISMQLLNEKENLWSFSVLEFLIKTPVHKK